MVTKLMSLRIVNRFEVIEVHQDNRERGLVAACPLEFLAETFIKSAMIKETGETVCAGQMLQLQNVFFDEGFHGFAHRHIKSETDPPVNGPESSRSFLANRERCLAR